MAPMAQDLLFRDARPEDSAACIQLRGLTRENALSEFRLAELGITVESWSAGVAAGDLPGCVCLEGERLLGYCFGDRASGEVLVLALRPEAEGRGLGRRLLWDLMQRLQREGGHQRLFLGCSDDPGCRAHGFYRHLGWRPTGQRDALGDEVLEWRSSEAPTHEDVHA